MTREEEKQWDEAYAPLLAHDKEQLENKEKGLTYVKGQVSKEIYADILEYIESCDYSEQFSITKEEPNNEDKQSEDLDYLKEVFVDQYCNGGYVGDDFAGWVHISISEKEYLKFHYSM